MPQLIFKKICSLIGSSSSLNFLSRISRSIILSYIIFLHEKLKNYPIKSFKECLFFIFCLFYSLLVTNSTLHLMFCTYICYWSAFQYKYNNLIISCAIDFKRYLFILFVSSLLNFPRIQLYLKVPNHIKNLTFWSDILSIA